MDRSGEGNSRGGRVLGTTLAAGALLVTGGAAGYGVTEYRAAHHSYIDDDLPPVHCEAVEIVGSTPESVIYLPVVRALGNVPLAHLYTKGEDNRNFVTDSKTGDRIRSIIKPGIAPIKVARGEQGNVDISIVVSREAIVGSVVPDDAKVVDCPPPSEIVVTDR